MRNQTIYKAQPVRITICNITKYDPWTILLPRNLDIRPCRFGLLNYAVIELLEGQDQMKKLFTFYWVIGLLGYWAIGLLGYWVGMFLNIQYFYFQTNLYHPIFSPTIFHSLYPETWFVCFLFCSNLPIVE